MSPEHLLKFSSVQSIVGFLIEFKLPDQFENFLKFLGNGANIGVLGVSQTDLVGIKEAILPLKVGEIFFLLLHYLQASFFAHFVVLTPLGWVNGLDPG